jgi:hypothetical protein
MANCAGLLVGWVTGDEMGLMDPTVGYLAEDAAWAAATASPCRDHGDLVPGHGRRGVGRDPGDLRPGGRLPADLGALPRGGFMAGDVAFVERLLEPVTKRAGSFALVLASSAWPRAGSRRCAATTQQTETALREVRTGCPPGARLHAARAPSTSATGCSRGAADEAEAQLDRAASAYPSSVPWGGCAPCRRRVSLTPRA